MAISILNEEKPAIDGHLDDKIWQIGTWETDFIQRQPNENAPPSEQTAFKILFDTRYLYIGIRMYDQTPGSINQRMSRRDGFEGDWVEVILDGNEDLRSAFSLTVTAAGVRGDKIISMNGANEDIFWNPIWSAKTNIDEQGWTAEMKIPFSQLRFGKSKSKTWGLQIRRKYFRNEETSVWQRVPLNVSGWVSEFGKLEGLQNVGAQKLLEIQPYVITSLKTVKKDAQNPFKSENIKRITAGIDGKIGVSNDLTLDFTINPDFGQVEADPSAIALDGFQLFFEEQRPFFVENKEILNYQFSTPKIGSIHNNDNLFYSRRIGGKPHANATLLPNEYADAPERTTILGAAKFGGKTQKGLSVGILEAITAKEYASVSDGTTDKAVLIEPLTNYFVSRVQKDFNNSNTFIGGILTVTNRDLDEKLEPLLHQNATTFGIDFFHQWNNRNYYVGANLVTSNVQGSKAAILKTQTSIPHLFQKVDASHVSVNPDKTSLTGTGGDIKIGKAGSGHLTFESGFTWRSPELELNDIGFMREADVIFNYTGVDYNFFEPFSVFRRATISYKHWVFTDFGGKLNYIDWDVEVSGVFRNNWKSNLGFFSQPHIYSRSLLQGGPRIKLPDQYGLWWGLGSDTRKQLSFNYNGWTKTGNSDSYFLLENNIAITYQPIDKLNISLSPRYTFINHRLQYINTAQTGNKQRYITARLDQKTFGLALRLNYTITPNLTIQYYGQPFVSSGKYDDFNFVQAPLANSHKEQLVFFNDRQISQNAGLTSYIIDENEDGSPDYQFSNPDFNFTQFQSNLVLRFEYKPGSEIFLVWSQNATDYGMPETRFIEDINQQLLKITPNNTFLIKMTYRFY
ncbi:MAG: carbohydrate binding family 9 domain-containing protein [Chitinophagales bacterium]|nr:carbohydrate binding family 9 domain-containing protein [Chitinophagales bacterium]